MIRRTLSLTVLALLLPLAEVTAQDGPSHTPPVTEVTARDYQFEMPEQISSGWVTFEFHNAGEEEHYFGLIRLPEGRTLQDFQTDVAAVFRELWNQYRGQRISRTEMLKTLRTELPQWYLDGTEPGGGPGLTEPGGSSPESCGIRSPTRREVKLSGR